VALEREIHSHLWAGDGLHAPLVRMILSREASEPGLNVTNVGGWHSSPNLLDNDDPAVSELVRRMRTDAHGVGAGSKRLHGWANVMRDGAYHIAHRHGDAVWSGVYYVDAGSGGGVITFARGLDAVQITPQSGLMLLFPGDLLHSVAAYSGRAPRVSVGFNLF
jgi:hypothetical protein